MTGMDGSGRSLYSDQPDPAGYQASSGRPVSAVAKPYQPVRLGQSAKRNQVLLFTIEVAGADDTPPWVYEGYITDPVPARHYAQMLLDAVEMGVVAAETKMLHAVLGVENLRRLAECDALEPDDLIAIMIEVASRAAGPYRNAGKAKSA